MTDQAYGEVTVAVRHLPECPPDVGQRIGAEAAHSDQQVGNSEASVTGPWPPTTATGTIRNSDSWVGLTGTLPRSPPPRRTRTTPAGLLGVRLAASVGSGRRTALVAITAIRRR
jgi:hypothetical protein